MVSPGKLSRNSRKTGGRRYWQTLMLAAMRSSPLFQSVQERSLLRALAISSRIRVADPAKSKPARVREMLREVRWKRRQPRSTSRAWMERLTPEVVRPSSLAVWPMFKVRARVVKTRSWELSRSGFKGNDGLGSLRNDQRFRSANQYTKGRGPFSGMACQLLTTADHVTRHSQPRVRCARPAALL